MALNFNKRIPILYFKCDFMCIGRSLVIVISGAVVIRFKGLGFRS